MPIFRAVIVTLLAFMSLSSWGDVQTYPWPETSPQSEKYSVEISQDGVTYYPKELYSEPNLDTSGYDGHGVSWVNNRSMTYVPFSFSGEVEVRVEKLYGTSAERVEISPKSYGIQAESFDGNVVTFKLDHSHLPAYISVNFVSSDNQDTPPNSAIAIKHGLMLFGDQPLQAADIIEPTDSGVVNFATATHRDQIEEANIIYFPAGDHDLRTLFGKVNGATGTDARIFLEKNGQQIYLAPGAFVRGSIDADGHDNLKLTGRGVITGADFYWHYFQDAGCNKSNCKAAYLEFNGSDDTTFKDIIIVNPTHHTIPSGNRTTIKNIKIIGWASNHDGVRPGNGSTVDQVFIKTSDDLDYARGLHTFKDSVIWPMRNGAFGMLGWNDLGDGNAQYDNIHFIHSEWDLDASEKRNTGIIGSVLNQGVNQANNKVENIYAEWGTGMLANISIEYDNSASQKSPNSRGWGLLKDFTFKNILLEGEFQNSGGVLVKNQIKGFEKDGAKATIENFSFINIVAGNTIVTNANKDQFFDIDPNTTRNINFTTEGNIYYTEVSHNAGGIVRPSGSVPTPEGMTRYLSVIADDGKCIQEVIVDGESKGRLQTVYFESVNTAHTVQVIFADGKDTFNQTSTCGGTGTQPEPVLPLVPALDLASAANCSTVDLSWTADITETDSFALYREGEGQALAQLEKGQTSYQDTSAISGATNSYYLIAKNTHGQTSSNTLGVAVPACPLPLKPVLSAHSDQCDSVALSWNADVTHTQSFELLRMDSGTTTPVSVATPSLSARELVDTNNLDAATSYSYTLRAINDHGYTDSLVALASTPNCMVPEPESKPDQIPNSQEPTQSETGSSGGGTSSIWFLILLAGLLGQRRRFV